MSTDREERTAAVPSFAVVGAVNHGKSSVVAAFAEDDDVRISSMPGETVHTQSFRLRDLLVFHDTPGFQNPREALRALEALPPADTPLATFARFIEHYRHDPRFDAECRLLQPIVDGAGILYVVDGSRAMRDINLSEMEILRRTGAPRLAIINRTTRVDHVDPWKAQLDQHFNIVRAFDAHRAGFADRLDLIESLALIERSGTGRLRDAARALADERTARIGEVADLIVALLLGLLRHSERARIAPGGETARGGVSGGPADPGPTAANPRPIDTTGERTSPERTAEVLRATYLARVASMEHEAHRRIIALYAHRRVAPDRMPTASFADDLFAERTWRLLGLDAGQLLGVSAVAGGIAGAGLDAATLGHSLGLGALIGAAGGGLGAYLLGKGRPEVALGWPTSTLPRFARPLLAKRAVRLGGGDLVVGPLKADNFPWIVIDRALGLFACVYLRSHARRDDVVAPVEAMLATLDRRRLTVAHWSDAIRRTCQTTFRRVRDGKPLTDDEAAALRAALVAALTRVADEERDIDPTTAPAEARTTAAR